MSGMRAMSAYDVRYDPNEIAANGTIVVRRTRDFVQALELESGSELWAGDDEVPPVRARVVALDGDRVTMFLDFDHPDSKAAGAA